MAPVPSHRWLRPQLSICFTLENKGGTHARADIYKRTERTKILPSIMSRTLSVCRIFPLESQQQKKWPPNN